VNTYTLSCLDSIDWSKCEAQSISQCRWSPNPAPAATVQGLYLNDRALVFRLVSLAPPTRAVNTEPDSAVWEDSCLECFFSFDGKNYVNLEANANSALRASFGPDRHNRKFLKDMDVPMPAVHAKELKEGWGLVLSIPLELVERLWGVKAHSGTWFHANFYSCGDKTPLPHYASWNPVETESPDFHRPEYFGKGVLRRGGGEFYFSDNFSFVSEHYGAFRAADINSNSHFAVFLSKTLAERKLIQSIWS